MKKIHVLIIFLMTFLLLFNGNTNIYAHSENISNEQILDYINENSGEDMTVVLTSSKNNDETTNIDYSESINDIQNYLDSYFSEYNWYIESSYSTELISNAAPINMQGEKFPKADIQQALENTNADSTYGGCGAIAMMGILDYFARYLGYEEIISDPTNSNQRIRLAEDVLNEIISFELGFSDKQTLILPWDYVSAFNELIKNYGLEDHITADYSGSILIGNNRDEYMRIIEEYIPKGTPVTMYMGLIEGNGDFMGHYVNIFAYENWIGYNDLTGEQINKTFLNARINYRRTDNGFYYADSEILNNAMCGLIYYDINYDYENNIIASDFSQHFINTTTGQGQYFFDEKSATVTSSAGYTFETNRLRCSYIENEFLVLSANRNNAGSAFLEFKLTNDIKKINLDISLWGPNENFIDGDKIALQIPQVNLNGEIEWIDHKVFDIFSLSTLKSYPDNYSILFPENISRFRIIVIKENPSGNSNKGRVVLDNITFSYDEEDDSHIHNCFFYIINDTHHYGICNCGYESIGGHVIRSSDSNFRYANCIECNELIDLTSTIVPIIPYNLNNNMKTINGSYISSNGIIILVDSDVESYFNGTLVFYNSEDIPITN